MSDTGIRIHTNPNPYRSTPSYHQISYCTPASVREVLPPWPKVDALAVAAASFQLALVTYRRSSGRAQKSSPTDSVGAIVTLFRR
jgi:hypothetical protein